MCRFFDVSIFFVFFSILFSNSAQAFNTPFIESSGLNVGIGYRSDQFDWSISGDTAAGQPNILSELHWDDIEILQLQIGSSLELGGLPYLKHNSLVEVDISFGKIINGDVRDSDYAADDRNDEWSRSMNDADEGLTADLSGAFGPIFKLKSITGVSIMPLVGYDFNMQALSMTNGEQVVSEPTLRLEGNSYPSEIGSLQGLDSSYTAYWYGPWVGANLDYEANDHFKISVGFEYHWVDYFAQADWNLRTEFRHPVSFEHEARGTGVVYDFQGEFLLNEQWSWVFSGNIQNWKTESGSDRTYFTDGSVGLSRLNQVNWDSYALTTGLQYQF
ncbi:hypothetical protein [uncultured Desulfuromusa sp.]|uniref:hypothetical protein n=1 Tax=uncultured Desulfuromusa sp. TaxID=219183 RepID=UPI002AA6AAE2|nr:hypothetical protein [uncultured Desulfuromusa sp.]